LVSSAASVFVDIPGYVFVPLSADRAAGLAREFKLLFSRLKPVEVAARGVVTEKGSRVPVRVVSVSFTFPPRAPIQALAEQIKREFLDPAPGSSATALGGRVFYELDTASKFPTESVSILTRDVYVYIFGFAQSLTENVARRLLHAYPTLSEESRGVWTPRP
jgi:hypothetical protein